MCGRFTLTVDPDDLQQAFPGFHLPGHSPRYNIAPTQPVLAVTAGGVGDFFLWGLIPSWAKDPSIGGRLINARSETLPEKPAFRAAYKYRRCLIPADGFYEWQAQPGQKARTPHWIRLKTGQPFAFAGLWEEWHSPDGSQVKSCTIITTRPNDLIATIHNRMPIILPPSNYAQWLETPPAKTGDLAALLAPYPAGQMAASRVSTLVNNPANDRPECILPA
jgi:putative SOS response-associated peptidase YedK